MLSCFYGPLSLMHITQTVSSHPFGLFWSPERINGDTELIVVLSVLPTHPGPYRKHRVTGQTAGFVFSKNSDGASPKSGDALVEENTSSGIIGVDFNERVPAQSAF